MHRFVHVGFCFPGPYKVRDLEPAFSLIGDWIRFSPLNWIVWTDKTTSEIYGWLLTYLDSQDQMIIAPLDISQIAGSASPWVWAWINGKKAGPPVNYGESLFSSSWFSALPKPSDSNK